MSTTEYFNRLGINESTNPDLHLLNTIQHAHLLAVPFENLDIHYGAPILLDIDRFYHKIINKQRGGFCYEINGLLSWLLREIGFETTLISAGIHKENGEFGPMKEHLALMVKCEDQAYLVDAGFGKFSMYPLPIIYDQELIDPLGTYKFEHHSAELIILSSFKESKWGPEYIFSTSPRKLIDFEERCHFQQTSPESHFTKKKMITRLTPAGRITLHEDKFIQTVHKERKEMAVTSSNQFDSLLHQYFGPSFAFNGNAKK